MFMALLHWNSVKGVDSMSPAVSFMETVRFIAMVMDLLIRFLLF